MYLVLIECEKSDEKVSYTPKIEKIQSFEYQLKSDKWSAVDFVPEKGAMFEIHFGEDSTKNSQSDRYYCACLLTDTSKNAITLACNMIIYFENNQSETDCVAADCDFGMVLYIENDTDAGSLIGINNI